MDTWEPRSVSADVAKGMAGMVIVVAAAVAWFAVALANSEGWGGN